MGTPSLKITSSSPSPDSRNATTPRSDRAKLIERPPAWTLFSGKRMSVQALSDCAVVIIAKVPAR